MAAVSKVANLIPFAPISQEKKGAPMTYGIGPQFARRAVVWSLHLKANLVEVAMGPQVAHTAEMKKERKVDYQDQV